LPRFWVAASEAASDATPSCMQPSPAIAYTQWSNTEVPGSADGSNSSRLRRADMAKPTALATPAPSGPVVHSTPLVQPNSG